MRASIFAASAIAVVVVACSSTSSTPAPANATCASPGAATAGAADTHCQGQTPQPVSEASCHVTDAGPSAGDDDDGGPTGDAGSPVEACDYGATMFGTQGDDDDCKYHLVWSTTPICEGNAGVTFTAKVTTLADGAPVTGVPNGVIVEAFIPTNPNAACDVQSTHPSPGANVLTESPAGSGTYVGNVVFDAPGQWTVRFHIHEECADVLDDSPHGHAAFRVTVP